MRSHAFYAAGWRLRVLSAALRNRAFVPARRLLAAHALAPLRDVRAGLEAAVLEEPLIHRARSLPHDASRDAPPQGRGAPCTARDLVAAYCTQRTTPREVVERALTAMASREGTFLRAFVHLDARDVRAQADASTERWRNRRALGPLDGVPIAVKDEFEVIGQPTTCGTAFLGRTLAAEDAVAVARLRAAGAILFGKTNMTEVGMGSSGLNVHVGVARNPFDPSCDSGGSSSGSAVAVAAGVVPIALGTDSGGSLRVPGSLCGVAAHKGTFGWVPTHGIASPFSSVLHAGALGASVCDVVMASAILARDPAFAGVLDRDWHSPLRIGICHRLWRDAQSDVANIGWSAVELLLARGAIEVPIALPNTDVTMALGFAVLGGEAAAAFPPETARQLSPVVGAILDLARGISRSQHERARHARALVVADLASAFARADVIVLPTTAITAPSYASEAIETGVFDERLSRELTAATLPACLAGVPAAQVPCGYDRRGMPVGLQIMAPRGRDALALRVAAEVERGVPWQRPAIWFDLLESLRG